MGSAGHPLSILLIRAEMGCPLPAWVTKGGLAGALAGTGAPYEFRQANLNDGGRFPPFLRPAS